MDSNQTTNPTPGHNRPIEAIPLSLFDKATRLATLIQDMEPSCRRLFCELLEMEMSPFRQARGVPEYEKRQI
jgi:hypothetical protein